jgi:hypothetical protein
MTCGTLTIGMDLKSRRSLKWNFVIAYVSTWIIGTDSLYSYGLLIDPRRKQIIASTTKLLTVEIKEPKDNYCQFSIPPAA